MTAQSFHGWSIHYSEDNEGHPEVEMRKSGFVTMGERGEHGIDPDIMLQRLKPRILQQEVDAASPDDRSLWQQRLDVAIAERDDARELRVMQTAQAERARLREESRPGSEG